MVPYLETQVPVSGCANPTRALCKCSPCLLEYIPSYLDLHPPFTCLFRAALLNVLVRDYNEHHNLAMIPNLINN